MCGGVSVSSEKVEWKMIGDILAKLGRGETLSTIEQQAIRLWGNQTNINNAFIAGLQNGQSGLSVSHIDVVDRINLGKEVLAGVSLRLKRTTSFSLPSGTTTIEWNEEEYDDSDFFNLSVSSTNITIPLTGIYNATLGVYVKAGAVANHHYVSTNRAGVSYYPTVGAYLGANQNYILAASDERTYEKGETVLVKASQVSGVNSTLETGYFTMRLIRMV